MNTKQRMGLKVQRPLAVAFGVVLVVAGLAVGSRGNMGGIDSVARWIVFGLLLAGVLAMTWSPSAPTEEPEIHESPTVHYTRSRG